MLNNFLSDLLSIAISTDNVDTERTTTPQRWQVGDVRRFMLVFGLLSSLFDVLTFLVLLKVFEANEATFQTAWFVVSLLTELMVVLVLRPQQPAWRSTPGRLLLGTTLAVGVMALVIPYLGPLATAFDFMPLPWPLMGSLALIVTGYVWSTEFAKHRFFKAGKGPAH